MQNVKLTNDFHHQSVENDNPADCSRPWLGTGILIGKNGGVKLVIWVQTSTNSEIMGS